MTNSWSKAINEFYRAWTMEKAMATHSSTFAWRIPETGEPGGLLSMGSHRVGHDWSDLAAAAAAEHGLTTYLCSKASQPEQQLVQTTSARAWEVVLLGVCSIWGKLEADWKQPHYCYPLHSLLLNNFCWCMYWNFYTWVFLPKVNQ